MTHKFSVGEYETRDGRNAVVLGVIPAPHSSFPLVGYIVQKKHCMHSNNCWMTNGRMQEGTGPCDLLPPATVKYRLVPDKDEKLFCSEYDNLKDLQRHMLNTDRPGAIEKITRREGQPPQVEIVSEEE